jgi:branched-chain amino acid transport system ATP-binding protein
MPDSPVLEVRGIKVGYGPIKAIRDCSLEVAAGETVAVGGANGAGKTTLLRAISRILPLEAGEIRFAGLSVAGRRTHMLARSGLLHVPEGRGVMPNLTVWENIRISWEVRPTTTPFETAIERVFARFPRLAERRQQRAGTLSGGEQQMLALARAIANPPRLLLIDEPSLGLSPIMIAEAYKALRQFQADGMTILLVEQNVHGALRFAQRAYILKQGEIVAHGTGQGLLADPDMLKHYLGSK